MYKAKAPFRLGLAGGGTDVSPYSDIHGGAVLNATVSLFAETTITPREDGIITISDGSKTQEYTVTNQLEYIGSLDLAKAVYNVIQSKYPFDTKGFDLVTISDVQTGSGLGTSSTIVVSILGAFLEWRKIELDKYDIASLAYHIEREELGMAGGKQDQYAAVFGGINFIAFEDEVQVNRVNVGSETLSQLDQNILLYYTRSTRESHQIILRQIDNVENQAEDSLQAMHDLKLRAHQMKSAVDSGELRQIGEILNASWESKKKMAQGISNQLIDTIYEQVMEAGAIGGKISGAGGGGFMIFYVGAENHRKVIEVLHNFDGEIVDFHFTNEGMTSWSE